MSQSNPFSLHNETALITGGGSGIGLAVAQCMAEAGARVVIAGRNQVQLEEAVGTIGANAAYVQHDVTDLQGAAAFEEQVRDIAGAITILVNNAGMNLKKTALETTNEAFRQILDTHVLGAHALYRAFAPGMIKCGHGSILYTASMASFIGIPQVIAYSAAKSAYLGMVRVLATECSPFGVRVNAIAPGWITTKMSRQAMQADPTREQKVLSRTPLGHFGEPEDIGWAAVYLCSPAAKYITGAVLPVDGGTSIGF
ncbi:MAG: SDR family NAD(P)-dependent oxidoreductase [Kiritimatiellae bacterium]|nr:SDR family NAD(P)-dependent oxidoreductase [Kiritimatiellia bacterium]